MNLQWFFSGLCLTSATTIIMAQPAWAQVRQVTGVRVEATDSGLEVILETADGSLPQVFRTRSGKTITINITNTQLRLPDGKDFRALNPSEGIDSVTVVQPNANSTRVTVTGTSALPTAEVIPSASGLVLGVSVPPSTAEATPAPVTPAPETPETEPEGESKPPTAPEGEPSEATEAPEAEEEIEIVVTGEREEEGYRIPSATTGTRTDTPLRNVPQSIQVVPEQVLEDQQVLRLGDALRNVSGVQPTRISSRRSGTQIIIRGFETDNILRNGLRDDTIRRLSETTNLERIEILKGPASVLFGQGDLGGTTNYVTKQPLREPFYSTEFTAGSYNFYRPSLDLTGPLNASGTLLYRLNASYENSETFIDFEERESLFVAPVLTWNISENTTLTLEAEHLHEWTEGFAPGLPARGTVIDNPNGDIPIDTNLGEPSISESNSRVTRISSRFEHRFSEDWLIRNDFLAAFLRAPESTAVLSGNLQSDQRTLSRYVLENPNEQDIYTLNTNLIGNFETGSIAHQLLVGVELSRENTEDAINLKFFTQTLNQPFNIFNPVYRLQSLQPFERQQQSARTQIDSLGIYVQDQISFSENLILLLGGRFEIADQMFEDTIRPETNFSRKDEVFSPRIGIIYKPIKPISLYASFSQSFEPVSTVDADRNPLEPERATQYEVGVKADFFDERLSSTLAFYNLKRKNVGAEDPANAGFQIQVGEQRSRGIELDVTGEILPGWNIIASYAYTDAEITEDEELEVGNRLYNVPEHAASLWTTYKLQSGTLQGLGFGLGVFFAGEREGNLENTFRLPQYWRTDAALFYQGNNFRAQLNIQNLFDIEYFESTDNSDLEVNPGRPLTVLGTISWEF